MEIANKELESFAYSVSHDLRAPLRSIDGYSHLLLESSQEQLGEDGQHYLSRIILSVKQMGDLIDGLLTFSRLGRKAIKFQNIGSDEMRSMVEGVIADVHAADESRQVEWQVGNLDAGVGDLLLVHQVWTNLLTNAFKYSRECTRAKIEIGSMETSRGRAYFVRDNGIGFDMQYVEKIFGVFQRLNRTEEYEGTGIGLALVKRIIDRHGGQVWAESRLNQGSTFYFTLGEN
jgi:light-regulated signal transduction histidine kinase (bacteriophytochrome)